MSFFSSSCSYLFLLCLSFAPDAFSQSSLFYIYIQNLGTAISFSLSHFIIFLLPVSLFVLVILSFVHATCRLLFSSSLLARFPYTKLAYFTFFPSSFISFCLILSLFVLVILAFVCARLHAGWLAGLSLSPASFWVLGIRVRIY